MIDLKPCPFCGGEGVMQEHVFRGYMSTYGVVCFDCCAETKQFYETVEDAARAWNRRGEEDEREPAETERGAQGER